ncbi:hypothetical protein LXL04_031439 [Taraxacum kok-saghyz]
MRFLKSSSLILFHKLFAKFPVTKSSQIHSHGQTKPRPNEVLQEYLKANATAKAILLLRGLIRKNTSSIDSFSLLYIIKVCTRKSSPHEAQQFHTLIVKLGYQSIIFVQTSLVNYYSAVGNLPDARRVFDEIPTKNHVCWTALISAYVDNQKPNTALKLFREMQIEKLDPDQVTLTVALSACADLGALDMGKWIHNFIRRTKNLNKDISLYNALLNMYTKCGDIETAKTLFNAIKNKDVTTWTSMITGHAIHGQAKEAIALFTAMTDAKINPNDVTFLGVLMACSHASMVDEGKQYFNIMSKNYRLKPRVSHFGCMVDLLCRAGLLQEARDFISEMPVKPNAVMWRTVLGACSVGGNVDFGEEAWRRLVEIEGNLGGDDVLMGNVYGVKEMWEKKEKKRDFVNKRVPGCSSIEIGSEIYEFVASDCDYAFSWKIYEVIESLMENMKSNLI